MIAFKSLSLYLHCKQIRSWKTKLCNIRARMEINDSGERRWAGRGKDRRWMAMGRPISHLCSLDTLKHFVVTLTEMVQRMFLSAEQYCDLALI